jgi:hypothetical protein
MCKRTVKKNITSLSYLCQFSFELSGFAGVDGWIILKMDRQGTRWEGLW